MDDMISRQAAIDICTNAIDLWHGQLGEGALVAVQGRIKALPPVQSEPKSYRMGYQAGYAAAAPRWIPCSKEMPPKNGRYLVTEKDAFEDIKVRFRYWNTECLWSGWSGDQMDEVLAWCELPKPWEGGQDGQ